MTRPLTFTRPPRLGRLAVIVIPSLLLGASYAVVILPLMLGAVLLALVLLGIGVACRYLGGFVVEICSYPTKGVEWLSGKAYAGAAAMVTWAETPLAPPVEPMVPPKRPVSLSGAVIIMHDTTGHRH